MDHLPNFILVFRLFSHEKSIQPNFSISDKINIKILNLYESIASKNKNYKKKWKDIRRPFTHIEGIVDTKDWVGIKNTSESNTVFKKSLSNFRSKAEKVYTQCVMIKMEEVSKCKIDQFFENKLGQGYDSYTSYINQFFVRCTPFKCLGKFKVKNKWNCLNLIIDSLESGDIIKKNEIPNKYSMTVEDFFWWCVNKAKIQEKTKEIPRFYCYEYSEHPEGLFN